jgi:hypothetical protein
MSIVLGRVRAIDEVGVWDAVLDRYRAALDAQRAFLQALLEERLPADVSELPPVWDIPSDLPPMPAGVHAVASALQDDTNDLIRTAAALLARPAPATTRPRPTGGSVPSSLDQRL